MNDKVCTVKASVLRESEWLGDAERLEHWKVPHDNKAWKYPFRGYLTALPMEKPVTAIYIGFRVLHEGITELEHDEDGHGRDYSYPVFRHKSSKVVWVFVKNERSNPFFAFPDDVEFDSAS